MREILFRGKPIEDYGDTKWFYGNAIMGYEDKLAYIEAPGQGFVPVEWKSVGQYIGLKDSNDKRIYEGDVVIWYNPLVETSEKMTGVVVYDTKQATYKKCPINLYKANAGNGGYTGYEFRWYDNVKVIGNIYENPELLNGVGDAE
ncbi:YopX family protein [Bacillus wiedmannii]|uniref:YopX family protein n=1 Tax=Bacillus wiedmannii TaxID=1890302 RepID=UPI000BEC4FD9|nr:YopX family protein [Bacillus wiedmannii]PEA74649.1 hypothetical protein CON92_28780 [Bacillus wiedmannii]